MKMKLKLFLEKEKIQIAILTSENSQIVKSRAKKLGIKYVYINEKEKLFRIKYLCNRLNITSDEVALFRPPFGITNPNIKKILKKLKMTSVGWDIRSLDTITKDAKKISNRVIRGINKGGSIILFHDRCESTLSILENIIIYCHEKGLKFKTINNA